MDSDLKEYNKKRDFEKSLEPRGKVGSSNSLLRYVIQHHIATREHYDLRLEWRGVLLSWAVPKGPSWDSKKKRLAVKVEDHPLEYQNFEGTIPKGQYGGGTVMLWDEGFWIPESDVDEALRKGAIKFWIKGKRLEGKWTLIKLDNKDRDKNNGKDSDKYRDNDKYKDNYNGNDNDSDNYNGKENGNGNENGNDKDKDKEKNKSKDNGNNWLLIKERDEYSSTKDIKEYTKSVKTGRTMQEIERGEDTRKNPFSQADAQLLTATTHSPKGEDWIYEVKYDGYRIIAYVEGGKVRLVSRNGKDYTKHFEEISRDLSQFARDRALVLDGEVVIVDKEGKTDFQALQNYIKTKKSSSLTYIVFDLLALDGEDLRTRELKERKKLLEQWMHNAPKSLYYSPYIKGSGEDIFAAACEAGMEGVIAKQEDSLYSGSKSQDWVKLKCDNRQEFVIGGYTQSEKKTKGLSSLLLGVFEKEELIYVGKAGTGFTQTTATELVTKFEKIKTKVTPFKNPPKSKTGEQVVWLQPLLVAEIKFAEWSKDNIIRQASYKGLRADKEVKDIIRERKIPITKFNQNEEEKKEEQNLQNIKITNKDRVVFDNPTVTKGDLVDYYIAVSKRILPFVRDRLLSVVRCPKGVVDTCFFKRHPSPSNKNIQTLTVTNSEGEKSEYFYLIDAIGLISEVQMGTIEFHTWGSKVESLDNPDMMVFDLDPDEGMDLDRVRKGVTDIKAVLDELSLKSYLKTSGGKGYHIVVPFGADFGWEEFGNFARRIAEVMEERWPNYYTSNVRKAKRAGKIFIDWIRNGKSATSIAPYSVRAREGAKVSMPITYEELYTVSPDDISMKEAIKRLKEPDPWKDFFDTKN